MAGTSSLGLGRVRIGAVGCVTAALIGITLSACEPPTYPTALAVKGGVEQLYVLNATPMSNVSVTGGPDAINTSGTTNAEGAFLLRGIQPGGGYQVAVDGVSTAVSVMNGRERSSAFYLLEGAMPPESNYVLMRDGTLLNYRVDLPNGLTPGDMASEDNPNGLVIDTVIMYSGYRPALENSESWEDTQRNQLLAEGYAVIGVNMRGTGCSGGSFDVMERTVGSDGYDVVETLNAQRWVDDIAMAGASWLGLSQLWVAATQPPNLDAIAPGAVAGDFYRDVFRPGGIHRVGFTNWWAAFRDQYNAYPSAYGEGNDPANRALPVDDDPTCLKNQALRSFNVNTVDRFTNLDLYTSVPSGWRALWPTRPSYWSERTIDVSAITVPTLLVDSWQDEQVGSRPYNLLAKFPPSTPARLIGTNGGHGAYLVGDIWERVVEFLDVYLDDVDPAVSIPSYEGGDDVEILLETEGTNFTSAASLEMSGPGAATAETRSLRTSLVPDDPDVGGASSTFAYAPAPSTWANNTQDRATFTSPTPLPANVTMAGSGSVDVWIKTQASDVDLSVTLSDVRSDGSEQVVQSGWLRASHRALASSSTALLPVHTHAAATPLVPGQWTKVRVEIMPFAHVFRAGSRLRLTIDAPNGSTYNFFGWAALPGGFDVSIGHSAAQPSAVVLPRVVAPTITGDLAPQASCSATWAQSCRVAS